MKNTIIFFLLHFFFLQITIAQKFSPTEFLINSTIKIESLDKIMLQGKPKYFRSSGTGFFFSFKTSKGDFPVIVTNRHVIKDAEKGTLYFKISDSSGKPRSNNIEKVELDGFKKRWILHPDTSIDLAILPIGPILAAYHKAGMDIIVNTYEEINIPNDSIKNSLTAIEDILMIGYPFGLRDKINDLPVVRKGITATPPYLDYNSIKEFLCDIAVYPGSSGSPILIFNPTSYTTRKGESVFGSRLILLGINYATYTRDFEGKVIPKESYNLEDSLMVKTPIPYNIGIIIKSERILDFKPLINKLTMNKNSR